MLALALYFYASRGGHRVWRALVKSNVTGYIFSCQAAVKSHGRYGAQLPGSIA